MMTASAGGEWVNAITAGVVAFRVLTWLLIIPVGLLTLAIWQHSIRRKTCARRDPGAGADRGVGAGAGPTESRTLIPDQDTRTPANSERRMMTWRTDERRARCAT